MRLTCCGTKKNEKGDERACAKTVQINTEDVILAYNAITKKGWKEDIDISNNKLLLFCPKCHNCG